jgi:hypothetical protein
MIKNVHYDNKNLPIFNKAVHIGGKFMHHFKALRLISLILGFVLVIFGCATSKSHQSMNIGLKAEAVPEGICLIFDNIPPEVTRLFISSSDWSIEITSPYDIVSNHADIRGGLLEQVKNSGKVILPFVKAGHEYSIHVSFQKDDFKDIKGAEARVQCKPYSGVFFDEIIELNLNDSFTNVTLSSEPIFPREVHYSFPKYSITVAFDSENIGVGYFTNTISENTLTMYFEPEMSDDLKKGNYLKNGDYPAYITAYCNLIYDNIKWEVEIAKSQEFTYSL